MSNKRVKFGWTGMRRLSGDDVHHPAGDDDDLLRRGLGGCYGKARKRERGQEEESADHGEVKLWVDNTE